MSREDKLHFYVKIIIENALLCRAPDMNLDQIESLGKYIEAQGKHLAEHAAYYRDNPQ